MPSASGPAPILALILAGFLPSLPSPTPDLDADFARILKLEDTRSIGDGALEGYLDTARPADLRVRAVLAFGRIGAPEATPYQLLGVLKDPAPEVRRMAAFALGEMDVPAGAPLAALLLADEDAPTRALAAEALGKLKDPASLDSLVRVLADQDPRVVTMALRALWKIESGGRLPELVARATGIYLAGSPDLRRESAYFLMRAQMAHPDEPSMEAPLLLAAKDQHPLARSYAARGLGARRTSTATEALLGLAAWSDWRVRVNAFNGLRSRPVPAGPDAGDRWKIYGTALDGPDAGVALSALAALESFEAPAARDRLVKTLGHLRPRFREVAALALAAREKEGALPSLKPLVDDPVWSVRARVAEALGSIGTEGVEADLKRLASDRDARVRSAAVEAAGKLKHEWAVGLVNKATEDEDPYVRAAALDGARFHEPIEQQEMLAGLSAAYRRALADVPNDARLAALAAMGKIGSDTARAEIEKALEDPDYLVRRRAAELLRDHFRLDRWDKVGIPAASRTDEEYLEAVRRSRRQVTATFDTERGTIEIELYPADAPLTVDNFIRLAKSGKLDGLAFHRVVPNFVIQDGDPRGDGNGGPPWQIRCEINQRRYAEGTVGMALSGKDTGGSQYFITHSPQPHLDGGYTVFGQVITGQPIVDGMVQGDAIRGVRIEGDLDLAPRSHLVFP